MWPDSKVYLHAETIKINDFQVREVEKATGKCKDDRKPTVQFKVQIVETY